MYHLFNFDRLSRKNNMKKREVELVKRIIDRLENYEGYEKLFEEIERDI